MDKLDQAIVALKAENKRLERELQQVRSAIIALQGVSKNGRGMEASLSGWTMSASARRRIATAQKARWTKWRVAKHKRVA